MNNEKILNELLSHIDLEAVREAREVIEKSKREFSLIMLTNCVVSSALNKNKYRTEWMSLHDPIQQDIYEKLYDRAVNVIFFSLGDTEDKAA